MTKASVNDDLLYYCSDDSNVDLVTVATSAPSHCSSDLKGQMAGLVPPLRSTYAAFISDWLPTHVRDCDEIFLENLWAGGTDKHYIRMGSEYTGVEANCRFFFSSNSNVTFSNTRLFLIVTRYRAREVCQAPLLLEFEGKIDVTVDNNPISRHTDLFDTGIHELRLVGSFRSWHMLLRNY